MARLRVLAAGTAVLVAGVAALPYAGLDGGAGDAAATAAAGAPAAAAQAPAGPEPVNAGGATGRVALAGPWTLRGDRTMRVATKAWPAGAFDGSTIGVPDVPNANHITGMAGVRSFQGSVGWYRTTFTVPDDGRYALRFESVNHRASIWLDGKKLGTHVGEYLPFELEAQLAAGRSHQLVVRADWRDPQRMKVEGWHRTWFNFGGINREVTIRPIGAADLKAPTVRTRLAGTTAKVDVTVVVHNRSASRSVAVQGSLTRGGQTYPLSFPPTVVPANADERVAASVEVPNAALWAPGSPDLYDLHLEVPGEAGYTTRTGLREVSTRGTELLLNGHPIVLRGASIHEDAKGRGDGLTGADMDLLVADLKKLGANATRSQHPLSPALLERLDAAGILVWQGVGPVDAPGSWTSKTAKLREQARHRVRTTLAQAQTHPSILAWNLANEVAGDGHPGGQAKYIDAMARELHRRDPGRLVGLDVWGVHPPKKAGGLMYRNIDAIGDTNYIGWYEQNGASPKRLRSAIRSHIALFQRVFPGKVLIVTEFGAESNGRNPTRKPGGFQFQADLLRTHIETYSQMPGVSGMLVWNLRDFAVSPRFAGGSIRSQVPGIRLVRGVNQKGLWTYGNRPKPAVAAVQHAFAQVGRAR
ncbi:MAG: beta-galactosidase [Solirubrobacteraceae bacterium]|nr:beta-galactosidase [Solirubrobacteraceae bacterium]